MTSSSSAPIAVIGAAGQQGGAVLDALLERGIPVRAIVRDAADFDQTRALVGQPTDFPSFVARRPAPPPA